MVQIHKKDIMILINKIKRSLLFGCVMLVHSVCAQTAIFTVTSPLPGYIQGRFEYEWTQVLNFLNNNPAGSATLQLNANNPFNTPDGHLVQLTKNPMQLSLLNNNKIVVKEMDNATIPGQGFEMKSFALPVLSSNCSSGWCWTSPLYGFSMVGLGNNNTAANQAEILFKNVRFVDFNKVWSSIIQPNIAYLSSLPNFFPAMNNPCGGGPPCLLITNVKSFTVQGCKFENYDIAVHYSRIKNVLFDGNVFSSDGYYGGNCPVGAGISDGIEFRDIQFQNYIQKTEIKNNVYTATPSTFDYWGTGIIINPCNWPFTNNNSNNVSAKIEFNIHNNQIKNCTHGIIQSPMHPNRTTEDLTYKMDIQNNTFENAKLNVGLGGPYRHFILDNNIFNLKNTLPNMSGTPAFIGIGSYSVFAVGNGWQPIRPQLPNNAFGFKMIYSPNTLNAAAFNNNNTFNFINNPLFTWDPMIYTFGDFKKQVDFIGKINFNGFFEIGSGKNTNIRELKNNLNGIEIGNPPNSSNIVFPNPIVHTNNLAALPLSSFPYQMDPSNGNLAAPTLKSAQVDNNKLKIAFDLTGNAIIPVNGPYIVEFYRSNLKGELVDFLGKQTINTLTNATYSLTLIPPVNLNPPLSIAGERIGVTLTSLGTNNSPVAPLGTSSVSYIYSLPCNDCISDFAPIPGKEYVIGSWIKRDFSNVTTYNSVAFKITFYSATQPNYIQIGTPLFVGNLGSVADGWQKMEGNFKIPTNAVSMKIEFYNSLAQNLYVDDVRVFPVDANMKSYAYDPDNMRLMGELDENNYATFYEYDEEGKLIRVKKETEKGIMTLKESRNNKPTKD